MKKAALWFATGMNHFVGTLLAVVACSTTYGKDIGAASGKLKPAAAISVAHIAERLKARPVGGSCSGEEMMAYLGIDIKSLDWDGGAPARTDFFGPLKDPNRSIHSSQNGDELRSVEILDSKEGTSLLLWTPSKGLLIPETATEDTNARFLVDQPVTVAWSSEKSGYVASELCQRAARWHDSRIAAWNKAFTDDGLTDARPFLPALDEIEQSHGTYTLRLPKQYKPDGTWGLVIAFGSYWGQHMPLRLRTACDQHKLLFVELHPEWQAPGQIWRDLAQIMDGVATLRKGYTFAPERTLLLSCCDTGWSSSFAGALYPDVFHIMALTSCLVIPGETPNGDVRYIRQRYSFRAGEWSLEPFPLGWMTPEDWRRNAKLDQRWVWVGDGPSTEDLEKALTPAWSALKIRAIVLPGLDTPEPPAIPRLCKEADIVNAVFK